MTRERKMNIQLATAVVLALAGLVLIMPFQSHIPYSAIV